MVIKIETEFPSYCIMDGRKMALITIAGRLGDGKSNNGCDGCAIYNCFGNKRYDNSLTDHQKKQKDEWYRYILNK